MSALRIRRVLQRSRRRLSVLFVVLGLGGAIVVHHGVPEGTPTGDGHGDHVVATCLGVVAAATVIAVVAAVVVRRHRTRLPRAARTWRPADSFVRRPPLVRARAGPPDLLFLRLGVLRR